MPLLDVDFSEARELIFIEEEGEQPATISEISAPEQKEKGPGVWVTFEISDGPHEGGNLVRWYSLSGKGSGFLLDLINKAMKAEYSKGDLSHLDTDDLIGQPVRIITKNEPYEGELRTNVAKVLSA